ncbi:chemotaxis protein CheY [Ornatilinea apprima]|uniref:Chemotaxis protein CheY n=1 Tax=Ornatilinea apprima TaxID=1134406 RepID=A0A0P6XL59_9CHLR|nr:chemotaxis protein CheY [Ornatilinea apprima]
MEQGWLYKENGVSADTHAKILYIEDDQEMIDLVSLILSRRGYEVKGAQGGRNGLEAIRNESFDLVLLDLMMPDLDGWDLYHILKSDEKTRDVPVIVITAKSQPIDKVLGLYIAKVEDYISKPFHPNELVASVEKVLSITPLT